MSSKDILLKEIDIIQSCISKVEQNSFIVKGWSISIVAAILALSPEDLNHRFLPVVLAVATLSFWFLDAFFLRVDRLYRWKYDWVINNRLHSMANAFDMNPYNASMWLQAPNGRPRKKPWIISVMFSPALFVVYLPLLCLSVAAYYKIIK